MERLLVITSHNNNLAGSNTKHIMIVILNRTVKSESIEKQMIILQQTVIVKYTPVMTEY